MNDCDWVAAPDVSSAKRFYLEATSLDEEDAFMGEEPSELTREAMRQMQYHRDDNGGQQVWSFRKQLNFCILSGEEFPQIFATTEY